MNTLIIRGYEKRNLIRNNYLYIDSSKLKTNNTLGECQMGTVNFIIS